MIHFTISRLPDLRFAPGCLDAAGERLAASGIRRLVLVTGGVSFEQSGALARLASGLEERGVEWRRVIVRGEPTVELIDSACAEMRAAFGLPRSRLAEGLGVMAVGGGSVIDAGKAIAAMLPCEGSVQDYLEGVGSRSPQGMRYPLFAAPTTGGTGAEATKNAVIAKPGVDGFKKSLRHDNYVPDAVFIDPALAMDCPPEVSAASGLDAITQLLESYVSTKANPFTDALAIAGLKEAGRSFLPAVQDGQRNLHARAGMAFAAYASGVCLAHAGLGIVHGIAAPLCGRFPVSHGQACGALVADSVRITLRGLSASQQSVLLRYREAGHALAGSLGKGPGEELLLDVLDRFSSAANVPRLSAFGVRPSVVPELAALADLKTHPVALSRGDIAEIITRRL